jgi:hypothetical protein
MFEGVRLRSKVTASFYLIFIIRRLLFVIICFGMDNYSGLNLVLFMCMNLFMLMYVGWTRPLIGKFSNRLEIFNELFVSFITIHMAFFTDWVLDEKYLANKPVQYDYGIMMNVFFLYYLYANLIVIIWETLKIIKLVIIKIYRWIKFKLYALGPFKLPEDCNEIYDEDDYDPIEGVLRHKKIKPVLFIQWYTDVVEEKPEEKR